MKMKFLVVAFVALFALDAEAKLHLKTGVVDLSAQRLSSQSGVKEGALYVIEWNGPVALDQKQQLEGLGVKLFDYLPENSFLVDLSRADVSALQSLTFVKNIGRFEPGWKVEPSLTQNGIFSFHREGLVTVEFRGDVSRDAQQALLPAGKEVSATALVARLSGAQVWDLAQRPEVLWMERYLPIKSMEFSLGEVNPSDAPASAGAPTGFESGAKVMNVDSAYAKGLTGTGQIVAFADTGLDSGDLNNLSADFRGQVKSAFAVGLGGSSWGDPMNHGTHVAGSIAGNGANSNGVIRGSGFGAKLVAQGMWSDIFNNIVPPGVDRLFAQASAEGARIHSNSWGAPNSNGRYDSNSVAVDRYAFDNPDFLPVFAAGNDGTDGNKDGVIDEGSVSSPGTAKNALTVGASKNLLLQGGIQRKLKELRVGQEKWGTEPLASSMLSEDARGMAAFSSRGPTADGRIKPEIVAPGTNIVSVRSRHPKAKPEDSWGQYDENYLFMGGTSMATPLTSGAMALIRQGLIQRMGVTSVSAALMKATVANTAEDLFPGQFGERAQGQEQPTRRPNNHEGWGRVNLDSFANDSGLQFVDSREGLATNESASFDVVVRDAQRPLKVTLAYTDAPGSASAAKALVNDLDLEVTSPSGQRSFPNGRNSRDDRNNMESVDVLAPVAGTYRIVVRGVNVPQGRNGKQPFALVISAGR
jgi:serine protease AprX